MYKPCKLHYSNILQKYIVTLTDYFSKWAEAPPLLARLLMELQGLCTEQVFLSLYVVKLNRITSAYHPQVSTTITIRVGNKARVVTR